MYMLLKLLQKLVATLNSDGTPTQVAAGMAIGTVFGLTPLINLHNLVILVFVMLFKVTIPAVMLGWLASIPLGFALDPMFDRMGQQMLEVLALNPVWTTVTNAPILALANLNNSVVLGSLVFWILVAIPFFFLFRWGVARYRETVYVRIRRMKLYKAVKASKVYNLYRLFRPE
jgi:uncharacterized protein (TIGR03546 family)